MRRRLGDGAMRTRFGEFVLDGSERQLLRGGEPVHLTPKAYGLLCYLVEQGHRAVPKAEILDHLWPATFVSESALTTVVKELRHALGDHPEEPSYIRGIRGFGYAFCADAREAPEPPDVAPRVPSESRLVWQGREVALYEGENLLGRSHEAVLWIDDSSVSRRHAVLRVEDDGASLQDCGSRNGTYVHGERIVGRHPLSHGEEFFLGQARLLYVRYLAEVRTDSGAHPTEPPRPHPGPPSLDL